MAQDAVCPKIGEDVACPECGQKTLDAPFEYDGPIVRFCMPCGIQLCFGLHWVEGRGD